MVILVFGIVGMGFYVGGRVGEQQTTYGERAKSQKFLEVLEREAPEIIYVSTSVDAGTSLDWDKLFHAKDADGQILKVQLVCVNGQKEDMETYQFPRSGVYEVEVKAEDSYGLVSQKLFCIPVQHLSFKEETKG